MKHIRKSLAMSLACFLVIVAGVAGMKKMAASKRPPAQKQVQKRTLSVSCVPVVKETIRLRAVGYGKAVPVRTLAVCPQVSGNVVAVHPALEQGGMVNRGEVLFKIDAVDYTIALEKAEAKVKLTRAAIDRYRVSLERDKERLATVKQTTRLARAEYTRLKTLYETDRVGTLSKVESAEKAYNNSLDGEKSLVKTIALYPLQIRESQNTLARDRADLRAARLDVERCTVKAGFTGRVRAESVEEGAHILAGSTALTLTDDAVLEIQVPLGDRDAFEVLGLRAQKGRGRWPAGLEGLGCRVETVTGPARSAVAATVHRVVRYDEHSRTLYLAVRVGPEDVGAAEGSAFVPLLEGMFCRVVFSARSIADVAGIPASSLNDDTSVYLAREGRLKTLAVEVVSSEEERVYVRGDFLPGDRVITTPLVNPLENTRLVLTDGAGGRQLAAVPPNGDSAGGGVK